MSSTTTTPGDAPPRAALERPMSRSRDCERVGERKDSLKESTVKRRDDGPRDETPPSVTPGRDGAGEPKIDTIIVLEGQAFTFGARVVDEDGVPMIHDEACPGLRGTGWLERSETPNGSTKVCFIEKQHYSPGRNTFTRSFEITVGGKLLFAWDNRFVRSHTVNGRSALEFEAKRDDDVEFVAMQMLRSEKARAAIKIIWRDGDVTVLSFDVNDKGFSIDTDRHPWYRFYLRLYPLCAGSSLDALYNPACWSYPLVHPRKKFDWRRPQAVSNVEMTRPWVWFQDRYKMWYLSIEEAKRRFAKGARARARAFEWLNARGMRYDTL